jgi:endoglucanase
VAIPELLQRLLAAPAPSGDETAALAAWRAIAEEFADVRADALGGLVALPRGGAGPLVALAAHVDEIGFIVTHVGDDGFCAVSSVGGWRPETLVGQRVRIFARGGEVRGVASSRSMRSEKGERPRVEWTDLHVDVGARDGAEARSLVRAGDMGLIDAEPFELRDGVLAARALDNRLGAYVALEAARRSAGSARFVPVATCREETFEAAAPSAVAAGADLAIVVDVTFASDVPGDSPRVDGAHALGSGAAIARGPVLDRRLADLLIETAEAEGIPFSIEAIQRRTNSDAESFQTARGGTPTALVSIPLRYMHTPVELARLDDVEACVRLLVAAAPRLASL